MKDFIGFIFSATLLVVIIWGIDKWTDKVMLEKNIRVFVTLNKAFKYGNNIYKCELIYDYDDIEAKIKKNREGFLNDNTTK